MAIVGMVGNDSFSSIAMNEFVKKKNRVRKRKYNVPKEETHKIYRIFDTMRNCCSLVLLVAFQLTYLFALLVKLFDQRLPINLIDSGQLGF